jgi:HPt (histidine-containing phosphotransfer) domain-containing protein
MGDSSNKPPQDAADAVLSSLLSQDAELWTTLEAFVRTLPGRAAALQDALRSGSFDRVRSVAHHLKAAGAHCGQRELSERAAQVEQAAHEHIMDTLALRVHDLTVLIHRLHADLHDEAGR